MKSILTILLIITALHSFGQVKWSSIKLNDNVLLRASADTFHPSKHKYDTCDTGPGRKMICLIDGRIWFGSDDGMQLPRNQLISLTIRIDKTNIRLDVLGMFNPSFNGVLRKEQFKLVKNQNGYTLYGYFSDGAGTYTVHWKIVKDKSLRQNISRDEIDFGWQMEK